MTANIKNYLEPFQAAVESAVTEAQAGPDLDRNTSRAMQAEPTVIESAVSQAQGNTYKIGQGETLYSIAQNNPFTLKDLMSANPDIDPNNISVGQELVLPSGAVSTSSVETQNVAVPSPSILQQSPEVQQDYTKSASAGSRKLSDIEGVVVHYTHSGRPMSVDDFVRVGKESGVGAPFFITRDGTVHQVGPIDAILQHSSGTRGTVGPYRTPSGARYSSANTIGIELDVQWDYANDRPLNEVTDAQLNAAQGLINSLLGTLNAERDEENQLTVGNSVFAHPELNAKMPTEGTRARQWLREQAGFHPERAVDMSGNLQVVPVPPTRPTTGTN